MSANRDALAGRRLDSWKEIAAFFGRAERTVKRWEAERGLPVHRVPGSGRGSVFAYAEELADWLEGRSSLELDADDSGEGQIQSSKTEIAGNLESTSAPDLVPVEVRAWPLSRIAAWVVPLALAAGLIIFLWTGHSSTHSEALANRPAMGGAQNVYLGPDSVAVLPFINQRGDSSADYLSDGITESLIASLARIPQLKVRSRDAVYRYKEKEKQIDVGSAGNSLGVSVVVTGRVMVREDSVDISAELTNVRDNTELWGHHYVGKTPI
jgi:TolB-like protein